MVEVKRNKYGEKYIEGVVTLHINSYLKKDDSRTEMPDEDAIMLLKKELDLLAGSNDGSELLANARPELIT